MRMPFALAVLLTAIAVAACGGGGKSGIIPTGSSGGSAPTTPGKAKTATTSITLNIPPASKQSRTRRPFYISTATQAIGVYVAAVASPLPTPNLSNAQIFPVATPSPCATVSGGGETCTIVVTAPVGNDVFWVATYATASPGPNATPLSEVEGEATLSCCASPAPLSFDLNAVVASITLAVPSADPSSSNTQLFTAGVVATPVPLTVTALDANNDPVLADPASTLANNVTVSVSPVPAGGAEVSLNLNATCPGDTTATAATSVQAQCLADLTSITFGYNAGTAVDTNSHIVDTFSIGASGAQLASPAPATVKLQSNIVSTEIPSIPGGNEGGLDNLFFQQLSGTTVAYIVRPGSDSSYPWGIGTINASTGAVTQPTLATTTYDPQSVAIASDGSVWIADNYSGSIYCWPSISAIGGTPIGPISPTDFDGEGNDTLDVSAVALDGSGHLWYVGSDFEDESGDTYSGYFPISTSCNYTGPLAVAQVPFANDSYDFSNLIAGFSNGIVYASSDIAGVFVANTASAGDATAISPALSSGWPGGVATTSTGTMYVVNSNDSMADVESMVAGSTDGPLIPVVSALAPSTSVNDDTAYPQWLSVFPNASGAADRFAYQEDDFNGLGFVDNVSSTPVPYLFAVPDVYRVDQTGFDQSGNPLIGYVDESGNTWIARALLTTTWNVPQPISLNEGCTGALFSVDQRGTPGSFTISASGFTASVFPNTTNTVLLNGTGTSIAPKVVDGAGRTETYAGTYVPNEGC